MKFAFVAILAVIYLVPANAIWPNLFDRLTQRYYYNLTRLFSRVDRSLTTFSVSVNLPKRGAVLAQHVLKVKMTKSLLEPQGMRYRRAYQFRRCLTLDASSNRSVIRLVDDLIPYAPENRFCLISHYFTKVLFLSAVLLVSLNTETGPQ